MRSAEIGIGARPADHTETRPSSACVTVPKLVVLDPTVRAYRRKILAPRVQLFKVSILEVVGTDSEIYLWFPVIDQLVIMGLSPQSYSFQDNRRFRSKFAKFSSPLHLTSTPRGFLWGLRNGVGLQKPGMCIFISSKVWRYMHSLIRTTWPTDGQTDGQVSINQSFIAHNV